MKSRIVALCGPMAAGKSAVGAHLAELLGYPFTDTDALIEARTGLSVADVFGQRGEAEFRRIEAEAIVEAVDAAERAVIALGGGSLEDPRVLGLCASAACTLVFLDVRPEVSAARILADSGRSRPLFERGGLPALMRLDVLRRPQWSRADLHLDAEAGSAPELAARIAAHLT